MNEIKRDTTTDGYCTCIELESPSQSTNLTKGLNILRHEGHLLDVALLVDGVQLPAHRAVLAASCHYFRAMFTDDMKEARESVIRMNGVPLQGMQLLVDFMYTTRLQLSLDNVQDVLSAANHVQMTSVVDVCAKFLENHIDLENCVDIASIAETYCLGRLEREVYRFMSANLQSFSQTIQFLQLPFLKLSQLLDADFPVDCTESEVLAAILKWIEFDVAQRRDHISHLLKRLNFDHIPASHLKQLESYFGHLLANSCHQFLFPLIRLSASRASQNASDVDSDSSPDFTKEYGLKNTRGLELVLIKVGGFTVNSGITNEITYCSSTGKWKRLTSVPHVDQCNFGTAVVKNQLYIVGGCFNQSLQENVHPFGFRYNPLTNVWSTISPMHKERCRFSLTVVDTHRPCLYAIGGVGDEALTAFEDEDGTLCEVYDPKDDEWTVIEPLPESRSQHSATAYKHNIYVSGGIKGGLDQDIVCDALFRLDTLSGHWERKAQMLAPRADHAMLYFRDKYGRDKLLVCGGWNEDNATGTRVLIDSVDCYDIQDDMWTRISVVPTPRYHAGITLKGKMLYIVGGFHSDHTLDRASGVIECLDLEIHSWTTLDNYPQEIWEHSCCTLFVPKYREEHDIIVTPSP